MESQTIFACDWIEMKLKFITFSILTKIHHIDEIAHTISIEHPPWKILLINPDQIEWMRKVADYGTPPDQALRLKAKLRRI